MISNVSRRHAQRMCMAPGHVTLGHITIPFKIYAWRLLYIVDWPICHDERTLNEPNKSPQKIYILDVLAPRILPFFTRIPPLCMYVVIV